MVKIINGAKYSTDTARCLASWSNRDNQSDAAYCSEELYRTKAGKYFLFGEGGPMSRYAKHQGNESSWGERIMPMTDGQARTWAEEYVDGATYELIFGTIAEDEEMVSMSIQLSPSAREKLDALKASTGLNFSTIISAAIIAYAWK